MTNNHYWHKQIKLLLLDASLVCAASYGAYLLRFEGQIPERYFQLFLHDLPLLVALRLGALYFFRIYRVLWRYSSLADLNAILKANILSSTFFIVIVFFLFPNGHSRSIALMDWLIFTGLISFSRVSARVVRDLAHPFFCRNGIPVLIYGAGDCGERLVRTIKYNSKHNYNVLGFVDDNPEKLGASIHGASVLGQSTSLLSLAKELGAEDVIVTFSQANRDKMKQLITDCARIGVKVKVTPRWEDIFLLNGDRKDMSAVREVQIEDLLRREPVYLDLAQISKYIHGRRVLITGAGGSIGSELSRQIVKFHPLSLALIDRNEFNLYALDRTLHDDESQARIRLFLADVTHKESLERIIEKTRPHIVFHAAAHKHVHIVEGNASEGVRNNLLGTKIVADVAARAGVENLVLISTDKAVNPSSVMGASKRLAEILVKTVAARGGKTKFTIVRFGNVLGSAGSVVPMFQEQIRRGGPITITHPDATRYFMATSEAVQLVLQAASMGKVGSETFVLNMGDPIKIIDLAQDLILLMGRYPDEVTIEYTGLRPGEKLFEELLSSEEVLLPTGHSKVFLAESSCRGWGKVEQDIDEILMTADEMDDEGVKQKLMQIFPTMATEVDGIVEDKKQRVLIVDDDPGVRDGMREFLRNRYDVTTAGDGEEALDRVLENSPDLVLLDVKLPRLNGLDVCKRIKENPVTRNIRVIMMSGYDLDYDSGLNALDIGADDYLRKPTQLQEIEARIRTVLKQAKRWPNCRGVPS